MVRLEADTEGFVVKSAVEKLSALRFPYSESEMLAGIRLDNAHADILANPEGSEAGTQVW